MNIKTTDTCITLENGTETFTLLEKLTFPDYRNVTARPYITFYYKEGESVWDRFRLCMERLTDYCPDDPYFGCYALAFRRLYDLLLSSSQAKNVIAYGPPTDCGAYRVFQDFMTFLQEGNSLTALAQSPFSFTALRESSCLGLIYCLDTCPALSAVCDAIDKIKPGGLILFYTIKDTLPADLNRLCSHAEKDSFASCTVYALTMEESLLNFAQANNTDAFLLSQADGLIQRANDLQNLTQAMIAGAAVPEDIYSIAALILEQTEEILLSLYDYLENDELPILTNALKEAVLNYYVGISESYQTDTYKEKLTHASEIFFSAFEREFRQ